MSAVSLGLPLLRFKRKGLGTYLYLTCTEWNSEIGCMGLLSQLVSVVLNYCKPLPPLIDKPEWLSFVGMFVLVVEKR